jgi:hypothetical protein
MTLWEPIVYWAMSPLSSKKPHYYDNMSYDAKHSPRHIV